MKKVVVVFGATDGLGKAVAQILAAAHTVVVVGKNVEKTQRVSTELGVKGLVADVTQAQMVQSVVEAVAKEGRIDCLINCAGIWIQGPLESNKPEDIQAVMEVNVFGTIFACRAAIPVLKAQGSGRIINVSSQAGLLPKPERTVYNASKWAVTGFTRSLALELAPFNISVSGFYPASIKTDLFKKGGVPKDVSKAMSVEACAKELAHLVEVDDALLVTDYAIKSIES